MESKALEKQLAVKQVEAPETKICLSSCHRRGCCGPKGRDRECSDAACGRG